MAYFSSALKAVIERTYGNKLAAVAASCAVPSPELGRLLRGETPLTASKLEKLLAAEGMTEADRTLLVHAAVRDFVGEAEYHARFAPRGPDVGTVVREEMPGIQISSLFPISPRARQVLSYLLNRAASDQDVTTGLELLGKFLELPPPE